MTKQSRLRVNPNLALQLLERNTHNRSLKQEGVAKIARDMREGRWTETNASLGFCVDGSLADGQHRLWAVVESGCTIEFNVVEDLPLESLHTIDTGIVRSLADIAGLNGIPNNTIWAGAIRFVMWYEVARVKGLTWKSFSPSKPELFEYGRTKHQPKLSEAVTQIRSNPRFGNLATPSIAAFVAYYANKYDAGKAAQFVEGMHSGTGLSETSSIHVLREKLITLKSAGKYAREVSNVEMAAWCVKAFNLFARNRPAKQFRYAETEPFPEFVR